jgi:hypothetical protein
MRTEADNKHFVVWDQPLAGHFLAANFGDLKTN